MSLLQELLLRVRSGEKLHVAAAGIALLVAAAIIIKFLKSRRNKGRKPIVFSASAGEISTLHLHEWDSQFLRAAAVSTITYFDYSSASDAAAIESYFRNKVIAMIEANPWLRGRLVSEGKNRYSLRYPKVWDRANLSEFFEVYVDAKVSLSMSYRDSVDCFKPAIVLGGNEAVDNDVPLFKVSVVKFANEKKFALVLSVCHAIVDGRTYYLLYSMLDRTTTPFALEAVRVQKFPEDLKARLNTAKLTTSFIFAMRYMAYILFTPKRPKFVMRYIQTDEIERRKTEYVAQNPGKYITTNDIIVSWFSKAVNLDLLFLAMNFRNRVPCATDKVAGNYSGAMILPPSSFASPHTVRHALSNSLTGSDPLPSMWKVLNFNIGLSTNWSTFYTDISVPGSEQIKHLPFFLLGKSRMPAVMVIFTPKKGEIGVLCAANEPWGPRSDFFGTDSPLGPVLMDL